MEKSRFSRQNWRILIMFGLIGQIAWSVENMYFNLFAFDTYPDLNTVTLMVQLSGVVATLVTLFAGTLSDKLGNRRKFISIGYAIWGVTVALFGFISPELVELIFKTDAQRSVTIALALIIIGDCVMTLFGSSANDAAFNAWVTDNTTQENRGTVEGVLSILPLIAMLIVAGGFGILVGFLGYRLLFLILGILISIAGIVGIFTVKDKDGLKPQGGLKDIFYGFKPSVVRSNAPFYITLVIIGVYGIACQVFMPYLIIYMKTYLYFTEIEYSIVFGLAILVGAAINLYLARLSDRRNKVRLMYIAALVMALGLFAMYMSRGMTKVGNLIFFGMAGLLMITGYIFVSALTSSTLRDLTPEEAVGKLQGVRMVFSVLIPMIFGPMIGNAINAARNIPLPDMGSADTMTTLYIPAPEIFLVAALITLLIFTLIPILDKTLIKKTNSTI